MPWRVTIDTHDDSASPGRNKGRLELDSEQHHLLDAIDEVVTALHLADAEQSTINYQITVTPCA